MFRKLILVSILIAIPVTASDPWRYIDPESKFIMGLHWLQIANSPAGLQIKQQLHEALPLPLINGLNFLSSVDTVILASSGLPPGGVSGQPPVLIVVSGQFDLAKVRQAVNRKSRRVVVQNTEIYTANKKGSGQMAVALLSSDTLLLGDLPTLIGTLGALPMGRGLTIARARELDDTNEFWIVSSISPASMMTTSPVPSLLPLQDLRGIELGLSLRDGFSLDFELELVSADAAQKALSQLEKTVRLAAKEKSRPEMAGIDRHMKFGREGERIRMTFNFSAVELEKRLRSFRANRPSRPSKYVANSPEAAKPADPNAKPVIWNLDPVQ
jgi:hypothetical protein